MQHVRYRFSLERFGAGAYNWKRKRSVTIVFPTLHAWKKYAERDFDRLVRDIIHYYFFERACLELSLLDLKEPRMCRRFRHSRCHCEYVSRQAMHWLERPLPRQNGARGCKLGELAAVAP